MDRSAIKDKAVIFGGKPVLVKNLTDAQLRSAITTNARNRGALAPGWEVRNGQIVRSAPSGVVAPNTPAPAPPVNQPNTGVIPSNTPPPAPVQNKGFKRDAIAWKSLYDKSGKPVSLSKLTDAQIREYLTLPANKNAIASGWKLQGGKVVRGSAGPQPSAPDTPVGVTTPESAGGTNEDGSDAYLTDPWYQQYRAELDSELKKNKIERDRLLGDGSAKGQIESDWQYAIDALTRNTRNTTSQTNAGLSGANLAGSGIARKALSDIAAEMLAESGKLNTDRTRDETAANLNWQDAQDLFNRSDLAGMRQATERWKERNDGVPLTEETTSTSESKPGKVTAPPGQQYVLKDPKNPNGGWKLQPKPANKPVNRTSSWAANRFGNKKPAIKNDKFFKPGSTKRPSKAVAPPGTKFVRQPNGTYKAVRI